MATTGRARGTWRARWWLLGLGLVIIGLGIAGGHVVTEKGYETYCGSVLVDAGWDIGTCRSDLTSRAVGSGALLVLGLGLLTWALSAWVRGRPLLLAVLLAAGSVGAALWSEQRALHYDRCGNLTSPIEWYPSPSDPSSRPAGCAGVLGARRWQVGALGLASVGMAAGAVAVVERDSRRAPRRSGPLVAAS
jgi:hypothetical protein